MKSFIECKKCKHQWTEDVNGLVRCHKCKSTEVARMIMGGRKPDWFTGSE